MSLFRSERLGNGLVIEFRDRSNRYFGDYHRVCVEVRMLLPCAQQGEPVVKVRMLERMGVAGGEVLAVRDRLAEDFWQHAGRYLAHPDYPARLQAAEAASRRRLRPAGVHPDVA